MKPWVMDWLCCPECGSGELDLQVFESAADGDVVAGIIGCPCSEQYPITDSIADFRSPEARRQRARVCDEKCPSSADGGDRRRGDESTRSDALKESQQEVFDKLFAKFPLMDLAAVPFPNSFKLLKNMRFLKDMALAPDARVVDIGSNTGRYCSIYARHGHRAVGVDLLEIHVKAARHQCRNIPRAEFILGDAERLPFRPDSVDLASSLSVLEHLPEPEKSLREISRILKVGGVFLLNTTNSRQRPVTALERRFFPRRYWRWWDGMGHSRDGFYDQRRLARMLGEVGISLKAVTYNNMGFSHLFDDYMVNFLSWLGKKLKRKQTSSPGERAAPGPGSAAPPPTSSGLASMIGFYNRFVFPVVAVIGYVDTPLVLLKRSFVIMAWGRKRRAG